MTCKNILTRIASQKTGAIIVALKITLLAGVFVVLLTPAVASPASSKQDVTKLLSVMKLMSDGQKLIAQGKPKPIQQGIEKFKEALALLQGGQAEEGEVAVLVALGMAYTALEEWGNAMEYYHKALPLARRLDDRFFEASTLGALGMTHLSSNQRSKAIAYFNEALTVLTKAGDKYDRSLKGAFLTGLGGAHVLNGNQEKGFDYFNQALMLKRNLKDPDGEAQVLNAVGATYLRLGQTQKALDYHTQALEIAHSLKDHDQEARTRGYIGVVYSETGEHRKALDYYQQAMDYWNSVDNQDEISNLLKRFGDVYAGTGETNKALEFFNRSLHIKRDSAALNNIGLVYSTLGEFQKALDFYREALALEHAEDNHRGEASALTNIGTFYFDLGELKDALEYYNRALPLMQSMHDPAGEASILGRIGAIHLNQHENPKALAYYRQALQLFRAANDPSGTVAALTNIGSIHQVMGDREKALQYFNEAMPIARSINGNLELATLLNDMGEIYRQNGEKEKALGLYKEALAIVQAVGARQIEATAFGNIAKIERDLGHLAEARSAIESALTVFESLRTKVAGPQLRSSYFAKAQSYYDFHIDLLMALHKSQPAAGYDRESLRVNERRRSRALLETLQEARVNIRQGVAPDLLERERSIQQQLQVQDEAQARLLSRSHTTEQAAAINQAIDSLLNQYRELEAQIRAASPGYAALTSPSLLDLAGIQAALDEETILLEFSLGEARSYLWLVSKTGLKSYELPRRADIEPVARRLYENLTARSRRIKGETPQQRQRRFDEADNAFQQSASVLSKMILSSAAGDLDRKRLVIVSDGILQYVPFAALPAPAVAARRSAVAVPLLSDHEIVSLPSFSTIAVLRAETAGRKVPDKTLAIFADPVFDVEDERFKLLETSGGISRSGPATDSRILTHDASGSSGGALGSLLGKRGIKRLPGTKQEAEKILALVPPGESLSVFGFNAVRDRVLDSELGRYRYVHFATHGYLDAERPEQSAIVLSLVTAERKPQAGFIRTHDIYDLHLPVDLIVLSACETGLGKDIRGEGLVGLTRGFMHAGAPRVVVSLWSVNDLSTAELMGHFYKEILQEKVSPATALRLAQIEMTKQKKWKAPFYWAAFVFHGEWN